MKSLLLILSISLTLASQTFAQETPADKSQEKGKLAGINAHMSRYGTYFEKNRKFLYEELALPVPVVQAYLAPWESEVKPVLTCPVSPDQVIEVQVLDATDAESLSTPSAQKSLTYTIPFTYHTYLVSEGRYLVKLYDQRALLFSKKGDIEALKNVQIDLLDNGVISWHIPLDEATTAAFLEDASVEHWDSALFANQGAIVSQLPTGPFLLQTTTEEATSSFLFGTFAGLAKYLGVSEKMEVEATKFLTNQLVDGELPHTVDHFLYQLSKIQIKEISNIHGGKVRNDLADSLGNVIELREGKLLHYHPRYGFARVFTGEAAYANYLAQMDAVDALPTEQMNDLLTQFETRLEENHDRPSHLMKEELQVLLSLTDESLDYSIESLIVIDEVIKWNKEWLDKESLVLPMIAYIGTIQSKTSGGKWGWKEDEMVGRSLPFIEDKNGKEWPMPWDEMLEMLEPDGEILSFYDWYTEKGD